jgi:hypothetical protein
MNAFAYFKRSFKLGKSYIFKFLNAINMILISDYTHVYIDESFCEKAGLATLTSIFIPQRKLNAVTIDFYKIIRQIIDKFPDKINNSRRIYSSPVLHGKSLLRKKEKEKENITLDFSNIDDDFRIEIFNNVIDLVIKHKLRIIRLGYNNYDELRKANYKADQMYNFNWIGLSTYIDRSLRIKKAICVMEGNDMEMINAFSKFLSSGKTLSYIYPDLEKSSAYNDSRKFIGNVFYVPARYCEYLQIVDIIAYILHKKDYIDITGDSSDFSKRIYDLHQRLKKNIDSNNLTKLEINSA